MVRRRRVDTTQNLSKSWQSEQTKQRDNYSFKWVAIVFAALLAFVGAATFASLNASSAVAEQTDVSTQYSLSVKTSGYTTGITQPTLDRKIYTDGDDVVLSLSGVASGNDFIIPTKITYGTRTIAVGELYPASSMQVLNAEYLRRMNQYQTITDYDSLKTAATTTQTLKLGIASSLNSEISVTYERVTPVYRMYNMVTSEHLFTTNKTEYDNYVEQGSKDLEYWLGEGVSWIAPASSTGSAQVYRLYNAALGAMGRSSHYYTSNATEMADLTANQGWVDDGTQNGFLSAGDTAIWTAYSEALGSSHHYTSNKSEWTGLDGGWDKETDKNGAIGVFSGILATGWSFDTNFYTVKHNLQDVTGLRYDTYVTTFVSGKSGEKTAAAANTYPGFTASETIDQKSIAANNTTVVDINYTRTSYQEKFNTDGGSAITPVATLQGASVTAPASGSTRNGYEFVNWYYDQACTEAYVVDFTKDKMPSSDITLYARWAEKTSGATDENGKIDLFDKATGSVVAVVVKDSDGNAIKDATITVDEDGKIVIVTPPESDNTSVNVEIKDENGDGVSDRDVTRKDSTDTKSETGKTDASGKIDFGDKQTTDKNGNATVVKPGTTDKYVTTITDKEGKAVSGAVVSVDENGKVTVKLPEGYTSEEVKVTIKDENDKPRTGVDVTVTDNAGKDKGTTTTDTDGVALIKAFTVTFKLDHATVEPQKVNVGRLASKPATPTADGYTFDKWYAEEAYTTEFDFATKAITADTIVYGKWTEKTTDTSNDQGKVNVYDKSSGKVVEVTVTDLDGNAISGATVTVDESGKYTVKTPEGKDGASVVVTLTDKENKGVSGKTVELKNSADTQTGTGTSDADGKVYFAKSGTTDESGKTTVVKPNSSDKYVTTITDKEGKAVSGAEVSIDENGKVTVKLPSGFSSDEINVTIKDDKDAARKDVTVEVTENDGTTDRGTTTTNDSGTALIKKYTVTFSADGSTTTIASQQVNVGRHATEPTETPAKDNCTFSGWYKESEGTNKFEFTTEVITGDTTVYAKFDEVKEKIKISFDNNSGSDTITKKEDIEITKGQKLTEDQLKSPGDRTDYTFDGWYKQGDGVTTVKVTTDTTFEEATTLMAVWNVKEGVDTKTITLDLCATNIEGATCSVQTIKVKTGTKASKPADPYSTSGYIFENWYTDKERQQIDTVYNWDSVVNQDITLYAAWSANYSVTFHANANDNITVTGEMASETVKVGVGCKLTANKFTATGKSDTSKVYGFKGWTTEANGTEVKYCDRYDGTFGDVKPGSNVDLYAVWTTSELGSYWLAQASKSIRGLESQANGDYYNEPESGVVKTQSEIEADLKTIATSGSTSDAYTKLKTLYSGYMLNDNIHLYTLLNNASYHNSNANSYAEFRIINVGAHTANGSTSDNSILTFQMTHALPTAYGLNTGSNSRKDGGYATSELHSKMTDGGDIYNMFNDNFKSKVMNVTKYTRKGWKTESGKGVTSDDLTTSTDKFWICSLTELASSIKSDFNGHGYDKEGSQYQFYTSKGVAGSGTINALKDLQNTRSGSQTTGGFYSTSWWTRSADIDSSIATYTGLTIYNGILGGDSYSQGMAVPVVPCFCVSASS